MTEETEFDWNEIEETVQAQARIAIYANPYGHIVIRSGPALDEDQVVVFSVQHAETIIDAIRNMIPVAHAIIENKGKSNG